MKRGLGLRLPFQRFYDRYHTDERKEPDEEMKEYLRLALENRFDKLN